MPPVGNADMSEFYYDYFALRGADIPAWSEAFFWPVSREQAHRITLDVMGAYVHGLETLEDGFVSDCCLIARVVPNFVVQAVTHHLVVERLRRMGCVIRHSEKLHLVPQLLRPGASMSFAPRRLATAAPQGRTSGNFRRFLHSCWLNRTRLWKMPHHFAPDRCVWAFNSGDVIYRPHIASRTDWVRVFSPREWQGAAGAVRTADRTALVDMARRYIGTVSEYARDVLDADLPPVMRDALFVFVRDSLEDMARGYAGLLELMGRLRARTLLTPTAGNPFTRAVSLAARRHGAHVTGFSHGYYICHSDSPRLAFHEMATVDAFMAYTPGSVPLFQRNLANHPPARGNVVRIEHENTTLFRDQFRAAADKPLPERIRRVMVLEVSLIPEWAGYHCAETMVNYQFYYSLCKQLAEAGYDVVFKKRPKSVGWEGCNILKDIPRLRVETRPFEAPGVLDAVDAVVLQYGMSSTLHWSMCSNKTVIFADAGWEPWYPDVYEKMAKRCRVLPCVYDERGRATFRAEDLLRAVSEPPRRPDTDYLESYLFP